MITINKNTSINTAYVTGKYTDLNFNECLFFDIETTGFLSKNTHIYIIGVVFYDSTAGCFKSTQWFTDNVSEECELIKTFISFASTYATLIHFNGSTFDIPYIEAKCKMYDIDFSFEKYIHIDLYKHAKKVKNLFKTENLRQKSLESFFSNVRKDLFDGAELINVYKRYIETKKDSDLQLLLLHNYEDITGMVSLLEILIFEYVCTDTSALLSASITYADTTSDNPYALISCELSKPVAVELSILKNNYYMILAQNRLKLQIPLYTGELKYYFENYKDYYYLPDEDSAIHKSIARYVDKNHRIKAKADNCYTRKTGCFAKQFENIVSPCFKEFHSSKESFFLVEPKASMESGLTKQYVSHIIRNVFL